MKLILVRHGQPDYETDRLTLLGHAQAEAAAERLKDEKVDRIFSSSCGRAYETALHTAEKKRMEVTKVDFMREITGGPLGPEEIRAAESLTKKEFAEKYSVLPQMINTVSGGFPLDRTSPFLKHNSVCLSVDRVIEGLDPWLESLGYQREGRYYRVLRSNPETVMMFGHRGSFAVTVAHLLNMGPEAAVASLATDLTGITVFAFREDKPAGTLIRPQMVLFGDARHIEGLS